jgi:hypothetical protein
MTKARARSEASHMTNLTLTPIPARMNAKLRINDQFKHYKPEQEKRVRQIEIKKDTVLEKLVEAYKRYRNTKYKFGDVHEYRGALGIVRGLEYSAKDVTEFSIAMAAFQEEQNFTTRAGFFLSALINSSKEMEFIIITEHMGSIPNLLGYRNTRNITIRGDAGFETGALMWRGTLTIEGNADANIGDGLRGGTINIKGNHEGLGPTAFGGDIYCKGNLVVKDGKGVANGILPADEWVEEMVKPKGKK